LVSLVPDPGSTPQSYDGERQLGIVAYGDNHYGEAIEHFRKATELDPSQSTAHLYLATFTPIMGTRMIRPGDNRI
jgi:Tetratricopeptide repeat